MSESKEERSDPHGPLQPIEDDIMPTSAEEQTRIYLHEFSDNGDQLCAACEPEGCFVNSSSTDNESECLPSTASAPPTYWPSNTLATYDSPGEQCQLFETASLNSASDSLRALESSSNWDADEHNLAPPHDQANSITALESPSTPETDETGPTLLLSAQFQVDDKSLKSRLWHLLHNRPHTLACWLKLG